MKISVNLGSVRWYQDEGSISALKKAVVGAIDVLVEFREAANNIEVIKLQPKIGGIAAPNHLTVELVMSTRGEEKHMDSFSVKKDADDLSGLVISGIRPILLKYLENRLRERKELASIIEDRIKLL